MYGLACRILGNRSEAEDLLQEIFLNLWTQCRYDPERGSLKSFLMIQVRSRALDRLRSQKSHLKAAERSHYAQSHSTAPLPLESVVTDETSERVQTALSALPENQRRALELSYFEGLSQQEISQRLGVPIGTVKSWFRLGFTKLRQSLQDLIS